MAHAEAPPPVDLTNCDREPIHIPGMIQPFGFLVAFTADWLVSRVSANVADFIGFTPTQMLGKPVSAVFDEEAIHSIRNRMTMLRGGDSVERLFDVELVAGHGGFDVSVHFAGDIVVMEAEPATGDEVEASTLVRSMMARLGQTEGLKGFFREGARQVRALTGFDRVMVYRFDHDGAGEVIAEAVRPGVDSFLGLNYPASDIPVQARALYLRNIFRVIVDVSSTPVPVVPTLDPRGAPLDLSLAMMRAVSPIHIEYLRNMSVKASLSISIVVDGRLWGLFACHHNAPRLPGIAHRGAAELFGQMFSMMLESRERREVADYETRARGVSDRIMAAVAQDAEVLADAVWLGEMVSDLIPCDGVGVYIDGALSLSGMTPGRAQFEEIVTTLNQVAASAVFATDSIAGILPAAADYADRAAGLIAIPLSRSPRDYVVLFRIERLRAVRWAGNPDKPIEHGPNGPRLTPRKSFDEWSELVKGKAMPFTAPEQRVAETLRTALLEVVLRLSDSATQDRRRANEQQELLIAELNHRVRNILSLIRGLISQTRGTAPTPEAFVETLDDRIQALARAHDQITSDRWGPARLIDLIETEAGAFLGQKRDRVRLTGPNVLIEPGAFTTMALVFHELLTNAAKYGALVDSGFVAIDWKVDKDGSLLIDWREEGGPAVVAPTRRGFGSTIIERSIPFDLGGTAEVRYRLSGFTAHFCVPARHVARVLRDAPSRKIAAAAAPVGRGVLDGQTVLLVEDSMIIALDGEDALKALGADTVLTAATVARALTIIEGDLPPDFALLDFNLGIETSLAVADVLAARGTPFAFATGYGDQLDLPERLAATPIIRKPYGTDTLGRAIAALTAPV
ncbi:HWE histidine kinase domain-containing protein [Sphingomonas solaris]|uniref:histidine kinase n=1 Tax=Alterirhizorhabdus solaris TaxID=2529389 RepID=A0A558QXJ4_9SPHN|nr:HWE histidine kinase domain-containing protein [Sphingomonas solaris]TVV71874.1 GAF domain-containing protein [Sphingomonas solaris]